MFDIIAKQAILGLIIGLLAFIGHIYARRSLYDYKLPPGPPRLPILGNLFQIPKAHLATYFRGLFKEYGGLVYLNLVGIPVILVGDHQSARELLEKHSAKNASRPIIPYMHKHVDPTKDYWAFAEDNESHTIARRLTASVMSDVRAGKTERLQEFEALLNVEKLIEDGGKGWWKHMQRYSGSTALSAAFGMHCPTGEEPDLSAILGIFKDGSRFFTPNSTILNVFPFLDWIPGPMPWRTAAQSFRERDNIIYTRLIDYAVTGGASGMNTWAAAFAREDKAEGDQRRLMKQFAAAAIETTTISLHIFVLACIRYPEWITTAQQQLDIVVGHDRMPSFKDRPFLPYIEAVVRELLRWRPAVRFGLPHLSTETTVIPYQGQDYFIPKGSIIFGVAWAIEHDHSRFKDPDRFIPERFLDSKGDLKSNYETSAFGFGRRRCAGPFFAQRTLWIAIATLLWTFNIRGAKDPETGLPFEYDDSDAAFNGDLTNSPFGFPAVFEPRSPQRSEVARREWAECEKDLNVLLPLPKASD